MELAGAHWTESCWMQQPAEMLYVPEELIAVYSATHERLLVGVPHSQRAAFISALEAGGAKCFDPWSWGWESGWRGMGILVFVSILTGKLLDGGLQSLVIALWPLPGESADGLLGGVAAGCFALMIPTVPVSSRTRRRLILRVPIAVGLIGMLDFVAWKIGPLASITFGLIYAAIAAAAIYALTEISSECMPILNSDSLENH